MGRPADHYTHDQFEAVGPAGDRCRCRHCRVWTGATGTLNRKKDHLRTCEAYAAWRAAGNGQELAPANHYNTAKRKSGVPSELYMESPIGQGEIHEGFTPARTRTKIPDLTPYYDEWTDEVDNAKLTRYRCRYCGLQRAKNTTRLWEHLQQCIEFLQTDEGQRLIAEQAAVPPNGPDSAGGRPLVYPGAVPNATFKATTRVSSTSQAAPKMRPLPVAKPSLVNFLIGKSHEALQDAIQRPFLSHAGCGTLSVIAVEQFLTQQSYLARAFPSFIGKMIGKIRLPSVSNPQEDTEWRAFDLLVSTLNNSKRELEFLRTTQEKNGLQGETEPPRHATKGLVDLMESAASPGASLLEGMIVLWTVEYLHHESWHYAARYQQPAVPNSTSYSLPTYYQGNPPSHPFDPQRPHINGDTSLHITAISESLIPNWTSTGFAKFVDACKSIVDELANAQTTGNGAKELANAERIFTQALWLWKQMWPDVNGMGVEESTAMGTAGSGANGADNGNPIDVEDDEDNVSNAGEEEEALNADTSYGGLSALNAANGEV